jgi:hypothetical protein
MATSLLKTSARCPVARRVLALLLAVLAPVPVAFPQSGSLDRSPTEVVKRYVTLDQKGARLDAMSFDTIVPYIDWREEPAWGRVVVIQDVAVPDDYRKWEVISHLEVIIPATFRVVGSVYLETAAFVPEEKVEEVRFRVKEVRGKWRIVEPVIPPHVGIKRMVNFVREAMLHEQDTERRGALAALEASMRKAR